MSSLVISIVEATKTSTIAVKRQRSNDNEDGYLADNDKILFKDEVKITKRQKVSATQKKRQKALAQMGYSSRSFLPVPKTYSPPKSLPIISSETFIAIEEAIRTSKAAVRAEQELEPKEKLPAKNQMDPELFHQLPKSISVPTLDTAEAIDEAIRVSKTTRRITTPKKIRLARRSAETTSYLQPPKRLSVSYLEASAAIEKAIAASRK